MIEQDSSKVIEFYQIGILAGWLVGWSFSSVKWGMDENDQQFVGGGGVGRGGTGRGSDMYGHEKEDMPSSSKLATDGTNFVNLFQNSQQSRKR
ncbi:hypothetical protein SDJN03_01332, partial [Cucurbita argyrosperma subsp. sororia]